MNSAALAALLAALAALLASCATTPPGTWATPSGKPEAVISTRDPQGVTISRLATKQWSLENQSSHKATFTKPLTGGGAFGARLLYGNSYSTPPIGWAHVLFMRRNDGKTRVILDRAEAKMQSAFGANWGGPLPVSQEEGDNFVATVEGRR